MTDGNMICPKCKTFQPRAETCGHCGVIVAKLWTRAPDPMRDGDRDEPAAGGRRRALIACAVVGLVAAVLFGVWPRADREDAARGADSGFWGIRSYVEAARDAQYATEQARERMEAAVLEAETGSTAY